MDADAPRDLLDCFEDLEAPRVPRTRHHRLDDLIAIAILAVVCGAEGPTDMADYGREKHDWLKTFLHLPNGIPSHDTFGRVLAKLDPDAFERCFLKGVQGLAQASGLDALHIDGKTLRRSFDAASSRTAIHMVSVWASKAELALAQISTQRRSYITSIDHRQRGKGAAFFATTIRDHWGIENKLHGSLDVAFCEDASRVRQGHAAENLARLRRMALNLLKQEKTYPRGIAAKRRRAGWNNDYLLQVLRVTN